MWRGIGAQDAVILQMASAGVAFVSSRRSKIVESHRSVSFCFLTVSF